MAQKDDKSRSGIASCLREQYNALDFDGKTSVRLLFLYPEVDHRFSPLPFYPIFSSSRMTKDYDEKEPQFFLHSSLLGLWTVLILKFYGIFAPNVNFIQIESYRFFLSIRRIGCRKLWNSKKNDIHNRIINEEILVKTAIVHRNEFFRRAKKHSMIKNGRIPWNIFRN